MIDRTGEELDDAAPPSGFRLVRIIIYEAILIAVAGGFVWGVAWELGLGRIGLIVAIVLWLTISPAIEIATVLRYREEVARRPRRPSDDARGHD